MNKEGNGKHEFMNNIGRQDNRKSRTQRVEDYGKYIKLRKRVYKEII